MKQIRALGLSSLGLAVLASCRNTALKMSCSQLVVDRIDPLVNPGILGSPHLHQLVGGNSLNATMHPAEDRAELSTCTTCTFSDDFSNYWTAIMYFRARNGTYKRVKQIGTIGSETARGGGITIYYFPHSKDPTNMVAFKKGFRMRNGDPNARNATSASKTVAFPDHMGPEGIIATIYFPPCWDGINLNSPDHYSHVSWPNEGKYDEGGPCPATHPVKIPQIVLEIRWDTREFNSADLWPEDGSQPFVWSFGDTTGYGHHGDYVFGWRGESLVIAFSDDEGCAGAGNTLCTLGPQTIARANECQVAPSVKEEVDGWLATMPGIVEAEL
ncbi:hypothetical protein C8A00DRAFT_46105 [Chaetomidium leptoderma]|uniref:DUF1996 domain-containing protein n=1 Tax=Chaetomidium leptoderma TaxID=669021 RepID=A0AAN6VH96_9PEZI|nr:hypothetical protein C8A00DRAFT_46105 [Chaetomidium leptoderma]